MTEITHVFLPPDYILDSKRDVELFVSHFSKTPVSEEDTGYFAASYFDGKFLVLEHHRHEDARDSFPVGEFYEFAFERFKVVLHQPQFLRYAKRLIRTLLRVDPESIVVIDEKTQKMSCVWPTYKELQYRIRIDELGIFGMEDGCVTVR